MKTVFRIPQGLLRSIHADLDRPHAFAEERVGFISCRQSVQSGGLAILAEGYHAVADQDYVDDPRFGAAVSGSGFRKMLSLAYGDPINVFHVHRHECRGLPGFSRTDLSESQKFIPDFWKVRPGITHGIIVLSHDSAQGLGWDPVDRRPKPIDEIQIVGMPMRWMWEA
jgi:hypothetical protein